MGSGRTAVIFVMIAAGWLCAQNNSDAFLSWTKEQAAATGEAMRRTDRVGNRMSFRGLKTDRAISYKMRATWLTPDVIRATARLIQLNERLSPERTRALAAEAEAAGDVIFLVELDPDEGSGIIPSDWSAVLQPKGLPAGAAGAVSGAVTQKLRDIRALAGTAKRDYSYDTYWVTFPLKTDAGAPLFPATTSEAELIVNIRGQEGSVSWPIPPHLRGQQ